jgi:restriction system protein
MANYDTDKHKAEHTMNAQLVPNYDKFIEPTFRAIKSLGGSGTIQEIDDKVAELLRLPDEIVDVPHSGRENQSEVDYRIAWARTYIKKFGAITNSERGVWSITTDFSGKDAIDSTEVVAFVRAQGNEQEKIKTEAGAPFSENQPEDDDPTNNDIEFPDENKPWRERLSSVLYNMNPYAFERLTQRLLRESGFTQVEVTPGSGDGGIDGTGKMKINGIFSYNVAFQCKRYKSLVGTAEIRDFRGSLTTDIEKAVLITTGTFSKSARTEACNPGKQQIDLVDGEELITMLAALGIGVREVKDYEIDEEFFNKI